MSKFTNIAVAASMAVTILGSSMTAAEAGKRHKRNLAIGLGAAFVAGAIIHNRHKRRAKRCYWVEREVWSKRYQDYIIVEKKVCKRRSRHYH